MIRVGVKCGNELHTIVLADNGQLHLANHSRAELTRTKDFATLGGETCRCVQIKHDWAKAKVDYGVFPRALQGAYCERHRPCRRWWYQWKKRFGAQLAAQTAVVVSLSSAETQDLWKLRDAQRRIEVAVEKLGFRLYKLSYPKGFNYVVHSAIPAALRVAVPLTLRLFYNKGVRYQLPAAAWVVGSVCEMPGSSISLEKLLYEASFFNWWHKCVDRRAEYRRSAVLSRAGSHNGTTSAGIRYSTDVSGVTDCEHRVKTSISCNWTFQSEAVAHAVRSQLDTIAEKLSREGYLVGADE